MGDMRITWIPTQHYGETFYLCRVEALNVMVEERSRDKRKALVHALESLARAVDNDTSEGVFKGVSNVVGVPP